MKSRKEPPRLRIDVVTLFPEYFKGALAASLLKQAEAKGIVTFHLQNPRNFTADRHRTADEKPFGGGAGMVLKPEPIFHCVEALPEKGYIILLSPQGKPLTQKLATRLARKKHLVLLCGHYEGIDERVRKHLADLEVSVGDFVTLGGEAPALCLIESVVRLVPGVVGNPLSLKEESFSVFRNGARGGGLEFPQYTRPRVFRGWEVPGVLLSGNHQAIRKWREEASLRVTRRKRPDLLKESRGKRR